MSHFLWCWKQCPSTRKCVVTQCQIIKFGSVTIRTYTNEDLERPLFRDRVTAFVLIAAAVTLVGAGLCPGYSIQEGPAMLGNVTLRLV